MKIGGSALSEYALFNRRCACAGDGDIDRLDWDFTPEGDNVCDVLILDLLQRCVQRWVAAAHRRVEGNQLKIRGCEQVGLRLRWAERLRIR